MTYAKQFREQASHLARQRTTSVDWVHFLSEEDDVIKKNVLRELGSTTTALTKNHHRKGFSKLTHHTREPGRTQKEKRKADLAALTGAKTTTGPAPIGTPTELPKRTNPQQT